MKNLWIDHGVENSQDIQPQLNGFWPSFWVSLFLVLSSVSLLEYIWSPNGQKSADSLCTQQSSYSYSVACATWFLFCATVFILSVGLKTLLICPQLRAAQRDVQSIYRQERWETSNMFPLVFVNHPLISKCFPLMLDNFPCWKATFTSDSQVHLCFDAFVFTSHIEHSNKFCSLWGKNYMWPDKTNLPQWLCYNNPLCHISLSRHCSAEFKWLTS